MYKILERQDLTPVVHLFKMDAPDVSKKAQVDGGAESIGVSVTGRGAAAPRVRWNRRRPQTLPRTRRSGRVSPPGGAVAVGRPVDILGQRSRPLRHRRPGMRLLRDRQPLEGDGESQRVEDERRHAHGISAQLRV